MKKYLLSINLLKELVYGISERKLLIASTLEDLLQKNESLYISQNSLNQILMDESTVEKQKNILKNVNLLCEKILSLDNDNLPLALGFESEFNVDYSTALELVTANINEIDYILDVTDNFRFQRTISVINVVLKTK